MLRSHPALLRRAGRAAVLALALSAGGCVSRIAREPDAAAPRRSLSTASALGEQVELDFWVPDGPAARVLSLRVPESTDDAPADAEPSVLIRPRVATSAEADDEERRYVVLPGVDLAPAVEQKVAEIACAYHRRTGKELVVTSGTRDPARQAEAMHDLFRHGADVLGLYKDKTAAREIKSAYEEELSADQPPEAVTAALERVIRAQIDRGVFISAHLREGAVDIRNRDMTPAEKRAFLDGVDEVGGVLALEESRPPHYHLQID
ncbi:hypothetical protein WMF04_25395 [Sorangium sp. So ce260]|uniref:hypothetical protein n=1 Tax=Sorangium sp. So ce260 TaxID=3133291 RepID=UPI003F62B336